MKLRFSLKKLTAAWLLPFFLFPALKAGASSIIVSGNITGNQTWAYDTVHVTGDITINSNVTLTIDQGVLVLFHGNYRMDVRGSLSAEGTASSPIRFSVNDTTGFSNLNITAGGWHGIRFDSTLSTADTSRLRYCYFEFGKAAGANDDGNGGAIFVSDFSRLIISHCTFYYNIAKSSGGAIFLRKSNALVTATSFLENRASSGGGGIYISGGAPFVNRNTFEKNFAGSGGGAIFAADTSVAQIHNNLMSGNMGQLGGALSCYNSNVLAHNNTIVYNKATHGGALSCISSSPVLKNNILYYNTGSGTGSQVSLLNPGSDPDFIYCNIQGGLAAFGGSGAPVYAGTYQNNLQADPSFQDTVLGNFLIRTDSPCLDAGTPDTTGLHIRAADIEGNPRINMGRIDIGAYERQQLVNFCGTVSQNTSWIVDTVKVFCDIVIENGVNLTIAAGAYIEFQGAYKIVVNGAIHVNGTPGDSVIFTALNPVQGWKGIIFDSVDMANDSSQFHYCTFLYANAGTENGGVMHVNNYSQVAIRHCRFAGNRAASGGAVFLSASSPLISHASMLANQATDKGGAIYCTGHSAPALTNISAAFNTADQGGGIYAENSSFILTSSIIANNTANEGAGIFMDTSDITIMNSIVVNNQATDKGGALAISVSSPDIINATISNNDGGLAGGAVHIKEASPVFINCILFGNTIAAGDPNEVWIEDSLSFPGFHFCNIANDTAGFVYDSSMGLQVIYENNMDTLPGFSAPSGGTGSGFNGFVADWSLDGCSHLFNKGTPDTAGLNLPLYDFAGNIRIMNDTIDIGAFELVKPYIGLQPQDTAVCAGMDASFSVSVESNITVAYQWQIKPSGASVFVNASGPGADSPVYPLTGVTQLMDGDEYQCVISAACSQDIFSATATLHVYVSPDVLIQPVNAQICQADTAFFTVTAAGNSLAYQWQQRPFGSATWSNCAGPSAITANYFIPNTPLGLHNYSYRCIIYGYCPPDDTTHIVNLYIKGLPVVTSHPLNLSLCAGADATFTVSAQGAGIAYQWQESTNGGASWSDLPGQNTQTLIIPAVTPQMSGYRYRCVITGDCSPGATSSTAILTVNTEPIISQQPADVDACVNGDASFSVTATGGNLAYQWQRKSPTDTLWENAPGLSALMAVYQIPGVQIIHNGYKFRCMISGSCPPDTISDSAYLYVHNLPAFYLGPDQDILLSESLTLDAGGGFAGYQWSTGAATQTILIVGSVAGVGTHQYSCTITDAYGCQNSDAILVTVIDDTGLEENTGESAFTLWPNPANSYFHIEASHVFLHNFSVQLFNPAGEQITEIHKADMKTGRLKINTEGLPAGLYYIRIISKDSICTRKISIVK